MGLREIGIKNSNILNYTTWAVGTTGSQSGFSRNGADSENYIIEANDPWGKVVPVWEARPDATSGADGGWNGSQFNIDNTKMYRFSVWIRRTVLGNGSAYVGSRGYGSSSGLLHRQTGGSSTNPYFWNGGWPSGHGEDWVLIVGHVWPAGSGTGSDHPDSGRYYADGTRYGGISRDWVWRSGTTSTLHRSYLYYSTNTSTRQQFVYPRVDIVDGTEPSLEELLAGYDSRIFDRINEIGSENETRAFHVNHDFTEVNRISELGPTDGLVGYWPLDGNADDYSGNNNHGTVSGAVPAAGKIGQALSFDGVDDYVSVANSASLNVGAGNFAISIWFKAPATAKQNYRALISKYNESPGYWIQCTDAGGIIFSLSGNTLYGLTILDDLFDNAFHHVSWTRASGLNIVYIDGVQEGSETSTLNPDNTTALRIGEIGILNRNFDGLIDDVRIYNRALSAEEVSILYEMGEYRKAKMTSSTMYVNQILEK